VLDTADSLWERITTAIVWFVAFACISVFAYLIFHILGHGLTGLSLDFFLSAPSSSGRAGGINSILVSTALILLVCLAVSIPIGLGTAVLLSEFTSVHNKFGRVIRRSLDVLAGVPSIVFGLFGNAFFCKTLGLGFSIYSGGLTLACMVLPILIRSTEEGIRSLPAEYRVSGEALAFSKISILWHLLLPAAAHGLLVGLILGIGRAVAETAALIFTSGYVDRMPSSLSDSGRSLSIHIYDLSMNVPGGDANAYKSAVVLLIMVLMINGLATSLAEHWLKRRVILQ
jgi:phosphate transport system permease protein